MYLSLYNEKTLMKQKKNENLLVQLVYDSECFVCCVVRLC